VGLAYERLGTGSPLVLFHGIGHRRQAWYPVLTRLGKQREVFLVDLPGHGESPPLDTAGRSVARAIMDEIYRFLDERELDRPHVAGNSLGGRIALEAAVAGRVASATAISPAGFWRNYGELTYARSVDRAMEIAGRIARPIAPLLAATTVGRALLYADIVSRPSQVSPQQAMGDFAAFLKARKAVTAILAAASSFTGVVPPQIPVTIMWGTRDHLLLPAQAHVAKARIPGARVVLLPGCGHVPMSDDPDLVARVLLDGSRKVSGLLGKAAHLGVRWCATGEVSSWNLHGYNSILHRARETRRVAQRVRELTRCNIALRVSV
jgi:pimeloyl-ACP methyl ester carboxylesterase